MNPWKDIWLWVDALPRGSRVMVTMATMLTIHLAVVLILQLRTDLGDWFYLTLLSLGVALGQEAGRRMRQEIRQGRTRPALGESPTSDTAQPPARHTDRDD